MRRHLAVAVAVALLAAACGDRLAASGSISSSPAPVGSGVSGTGIIVRPEPSSTSTLIPVGTAPPKSSPSGPPTPVTLATAPPTPPATLTPAGAPTLAQLKYLVVDRFGRLWYCDPDFYPVARADLDTLAESRFPETQKDVGTFNAILVHVGYAPTATYTHQQKVTIYTDWKMLGGLLLDPSGDVYRFKARFTSDQRTGVAVEGTIDAQGGISVAAQAASGPPPCPICLTRGTRIATPSGQLAVEDLRAGMMVWTADASGARIAAVIVLAGSMTAPADHHVVHVVLADGRELLASPSHPLADGRALGSVVAGDTVDGARVLSAELVPYGAGVTFDLLPAGPTGTYWAGDIALASTLRR